MKHYLRPVFALATIALLSATSVQAESMEKMVIALKTDRFELTETDISDLAIGEGQTIETESGKVIDILRTADGAEIYVDGELLEMNFDNDSLHEGHMVKKHVEVICEDGEECDHNVFVFSTGERDAASWSSNDGENIIIHKEIELSCTSDEEGTSCDDNMIFISEGGDIDFEELHELHTDGEAHKVIVIRKEIRSQD